MGVRPGYKQTEVGVIPEDWEVLSLGEIGVFKNGLNKDGADFGHGAPFVNLMNVFGTTLVTKSVNLPLVASTDRERQTYDLKAGDVLFVRSSVKASGVGLTAIIAENLPNTVYSGFLIRFRDTGYLDTNFKKYCFREARFRSVVIAASSVSANTNINQDSLKKLCIAAPTSKAEQQAIAAALSDMDAALAGLSRLIAKKRDLKQAATQTLLTGQTRLPGFSGDWEMKRLGDHVTFLKNGVNSRAQLTSSDPVRYLHYGDIHVAPLVRLNPRLNDMPRLPHNLATRLSRLESGDLVFVDASEDLDGVGKSVEIEGADGLEIVSGLHTIAARFDKTVLADGFKRYLQFFPAFKTHLRRLAAGTKVYATNRSHIASVEMELPTVEEQCAIAAVLSDIDAEIEALGMQLGKTRALKQAMMQALLTGRVRLPAAKKTEKELAHA